MWCKVVTSLLKTPPMRRKRSHGRNLKAKSRTAVRASITFPPDLYETLEEIAQQNKISLAWVVRDAAESYIVKGRAEALRSRAEKRMNAAT